MLCAHDADEKEVFEAFDKRVSSSLYDPWVALRGARQVIVMIARAITPSIRQAGYAATFVSAGLTIGTPRTWCTRNISLVGRHESSVPPPLPDCLCTCYAMVVLHILFSVTVLSTRRSMTPAGLNGRSSIFTTVGSGQRR